MRLLGAVLAGGKSTRFGSDKAEALLGGKRLLDHAAECLAGHCDDVVVVGRADTTWISIPDAPTSALGPLGGLCAALLHAHSNGFDVVFAMPCDVPDIPTEIVDALIAARPAVVAAQPVIGCWPSAFGERLRDHLASDKGRAVMAWVDATGASALPSPALPNINTPGDLS